ncbi:mammalian ependymin-related protein 1 [Lethenteron reissneri]|uniref:mammalian ependymin-related protein 1 n=1 Tax=Lethenteron reissneri TaxID=7753 RepID=UPI002AB64581|nr:mammalian ependymin-related protein 1 [Lethenteron reissneri]
MRAAFSPLATLSFPLTTLSFPLAMLFSPLSLLFPPLSMLLSPLSLPAVGGTPAGPSPCVSPLQFDGRAVAYDPVSSRSRRLRLCYDGKGRRVMVHEERKGHFPCKRYYDYIYLYDEGVQYQIDQSNKRCLTKALTDAWDPYDIPSNSTFEDQYLIGGPGDQVAVQEWSDRKPARKFETWLGVYTTKDCYPVHETYIDSAGVASMTRFFDIEPGIKDPSVFTPPASCHKALFTDWEEMGGC